MAADLFEGEFEARAIKPEVGTNKNGKPVIRVRMELLNGDRKGRQLDYEGRLDDKNIKYTKQHMIALGWQGRSVSTFADDVAKAARTVPVEVRIASFTREDGTVRQWTSIDKIGRFAPTLAPLERSKIADVDAWFAEAGDGGGEAQSNGYGGGHVPPPSDNDIPF